MAFMLDCSVSNSRGVRAAWPLGQRRRSEPSEAKRQAKNRAGKRAWSPIAAKAIVECACVPSAGARQPLRLAEPWIMRVI
jgi:hypothetical protein